MAQDSEPSPASSSCQHVVLCVLTDSLSFLRSDLILEHTWYSVLVHASVHRWWIWLLLWIRQGLEKFCVSSTTMVIKTELWTRVHSPVVRAADCRSAGPWFNSGWRSWIHTHWHIQRNNIMSPITTTITMPITTIPRKSVNMVAELAPWIPDTTERQEDYSAVAKDATTTAVALDTKARAAQGTVVQLKGELAQYQQSRTEAKTQMDSLLLIALKPPSDLGADTVVGRIPGRLTGESLDRLGNHSVWFCRVKIRAKSSLFDSTRIS